MGVEERRANRSPFGGEASGAAGKGLNARGVDSPFVPPRCLEHAYVQTILSSSSLRTLGPNPMRERAREVIFDAGGGVRLQGFHSPQEPGAGAW